jgi:hypothetical protein
MSPEIEKAPFGPVVVTTFASVKATLGKSM